MVLLSLFKITKKSFIGKISKMLVIKLINMIYQQFYKQNPMLYFSGDTMFCQNLIKLGQNCDLLIHEATMESGLEIIAKRKFHSTTSEAIRAGKFMDAKFILLTHFSQRYSKIPFIPDKEANVGIAYDYMEFRLPQLPLLPLFYPCIKIMFNEYNRVLD